MKYLILLAKLFCTGLLLYFVFRGIDFTQTKSILYSKNGIIILLTSTFIMILQTFIAGLRLKAVLNMFSFNITKAFGMKLGFIANFFSQILISFVGGDAIRVMTLKKIGMSYGDSARAVFLDRVLGFVSLQVLYFISLYYLIDFLSHGTLRLGIVGLGIISIITIICFFLLGYMPKQLHHLKYIGKILDLSAISRYLYKSKANSIHVLFLSALIHLSNVLIIYIALSLLYGNLNFTNCFMVSIPVLYISMLPFSIGGWGLREHSMIVGLGLVGVPAEIALSVSIILGLSLLISSIPGVVVFWQRADNLMIRSHITRDALLDV